MTPAPSKFQTKPKTAFSSAKYNRPKQNKKIVNL